MIFDNWSPMLQPCVPLLKHTITAPCKYVLVMHALHRWQNHHLNESADHYHRHVSELHSHVSEHHPHAPLLEGTNYHQHSAPVSLSPWCNTCATTDFDAGFPPLWWSIFCCDVMPLQAENFKSLSPGQNGLEDHCGPGHQIHIRPLPKWSPALLPRQVNMGRRWQTLLHWATALEEWVYTQGPFTTMWRQTKPACSALYFSILHSS